MCPPKEEGPPWPGSLPCHFTGCAVGTLFPDFSVFAAGAGLAAGTVPCEVLRPSNCRKAFQDRNDSFTVPDGGHRAPGHHPETRFRNAWMGQPRMTFKDGAPPMRFTIRLS